MCSPGMPVEHILLQQAPQRFYGRAIPARPDPAHRHAQFVASQGVLEPPQPELASSVDMNHNIFGMATLNQCVL
jgi:hypothetical protein